MRPGQGIPGNLEKRGARKRHNNNKDLQAFFLRQEIPKLILQFLIFPEARKAKTYSPISHFSCGKKCQNPFSNFSFFLSQKIPKTHSPISHTRLTKNDSTCAGKTRPDQHWFLYEFYLETHFRHKTRQRVLQDPSLCQKWESVCKVCEMAVVLVYEFASVK